MFNKKLLPVVIWFSLFLLIPTAQAHAYLDPGSGSLIVQVLIAALLGLVVAFRTFRNTILSVLGIKRPVEDDDNEYRNEKDQKS